MSDASDMFLSGTILSTSTIDGCTTASVILDGGLMPDPDCAAVHTVDLGDYDPDTDTFTITIGGATTPSFGDTGDETYTSAHLDAAIEALDTVPGTVIISSVTDAGFIATFQTGKPPDGDIVIDADGFTSGGVVVDPSCWISMDEQVEIDIPPDSTVGTDLALQTPVVLTYSIADVTNDVILPLEVWANLAGTITGLKITGPDLGANCAVSLYINDALEASQAVSGGWGTIDVAIVKNGEVKLAITMVDGTGPALCYVRIRRDAAIADEEGNPKRVKLRKKSRRQGGKGNWSAG